MHRTCLFISALLLGRSRVAGLLKVFFHDFLGVVFMRFQRSEVADGQRQLAAFFAEWAAAGLQGHEVAQPTTSCLQQLQRTSCTDGVEAQGEAQTACAVARAAEAARTLSSCLCFCSLLAYAVGFWPLVKDAVIALRASWRWHQRVAAVRPLKCEYLRPFPYCTFVYFVQAGLRVGDV